MSLLLNQIWYENHYADNQMRNLDDHYYNMIICFKTIAWNFDANIVLYDIKLLHNHDINSKKNHYIKATTTQNIINKKVVVWSCLMIVFDRVSL